MSFFKFGVGATVKYVGKRFLASLKKRKQINHGEVCKQLSGTPNRYVVVFRNEEGEEASFIVAENLLAANAHNVLMTRVREDG